MPVKKRNYGDGPIYQVICKKCDWDSIPYSDLKKANSAMRAHNAREHPAPAGGRKRTGF
jgi:hypothetical protein